MASGFAKLVITVTLISAIPLAAGSQDANQDPLDELAAMADSGMSVPVVEEPRELESTLAYTANENMKESLGKAIYQNELWTIERNAATYTWQDFSTKLIFWAVLILVFVGVAFSGIQFFRGDGANSDETSQTISHVEISTQGVKVSSPFLGVVLLLISLGFFYLYLVYVYPISLTR